jgi:hypothetical protein
MKGGDIYYGGTIQDGRCGLFKNKRLIMVMPQRNSTPFFLVPPEENYIMFVYHYVDFDAKTQKTYIVLFAGKKIRRFSFKNVIFPFYGNYKFVKGGKVVFGGSDFYGRSLCITFTLKDLRWKEKWVRNFYSCTYGEGEKVKDRVEFFYKGTAQYAKIGKYYRVIPTYSSSPRYYLSKNILILFDGRYFPTGYNNFLVVSLKNGIAFEVVLRNFVAFEEYSGYLFIIFEDNLYKVSLDEWVDKYLRKLRKLCLLQKKLCKE